MESAPTNGGDRSGYPVLLSQTEAWATVHSCTIPLYISSGEKQKEKKEDGKYQGRLQIKEIQTDLLVPKTVEGDGEWSDDTLDGDGHRGRE
jgi:hypothetical protein